MKIEDIRKYKTVTIGEILPGCVFVWEGALYMATDNTCDNDTTRLCVDIEDGRTTKFVVTTPVLLVEVKAVVR